MHPWFNPRVTTTGVRWWHINVTVGIVIVAVALAYVAGFFSGAAANNYYRDHYKASLPIPTTHVRITAHVGTLPSSGGIHFGYANFQINDQGTEGSCQGWAFAKQESYAYNWNYPYHYRFYSPRFPYDIASAGYDNGSYLEQYPPIIQRDGNPTWAEMPFGQQAYNVRLQPYGVDYPVAPTFYTAAAAHRVNLSEQSLFQNPGAGPGGLALIKQALAGHHMVNVDLTVYPEYDAANQTGQTVTPPTSGETARGGHANVAVLFNDGHNNGDGTYGAILASNQWGWAAGVGKDGIRHTDGTKNGYVWLSYQFVEQQVWGAAIIHVGAGSTAKASKIETPRNGAADGGKRPLPPPASGNPQPGSSPPSGWYVSAFYTRDTGRNIAPLINAAGDRYGIWPVYILAVVFAESGGNQYAARWGVWPDVSFGLMQVTTSTLTGYYSGCGFNSYCAQSYLDDAGTSISLGARILRDYKAETGVGYPALWQCYNAGPGSCRSPYYAGFLSNYYVALNYATSHPGPGPSPPPPPPTPKPRPHYTFPRGHWNHYRNRHHLPRIAHQRHGKLTWAASVWWSGEGQRICRYSGIKRPERWLPRLKVMRTDFARCILYTWPTHPGSRPKIVRR